MNSGHKTLRIGLVGFDEVNALDLAGPMEVFATANAIVAQELASAPVYELRVIAETAAPFRTESGLHITPASDFASAPEFDTVIVPGGRGLRDPQTNRTVADWLGASAQACRRVVSVCTGLYGVAPTGWLDGRRAATHWRFAADAAARFPALQIDADSIYVKDGRYYTSAGITAGIDLSLALVEEDFGPRVALAVARDLVVYMKRPGGQAQYSEPLRFQVQGIDRFAELAAWIAAHLQQDLSVEVLAAQVCLSPRQFGRRFRAAFGCAAAEFVEIARLAEARRRLSQPRATVDRIARSLGFNSADVFRRAFVRRFGITPVEYRERFACTIVANERVTSDKELERGLDQ